MIIASYLTVHFWNSRAWCLGFGVWGLGFGYLAVHFWDSGCGFWVWSLGTSPCISGETHTCPSDQSLKPRSSCTCQRPSRLKEPKQDEKLSLSSEVSVPCCFSQTDAYTDTDTGTDTDTDTDSHSHPHADQREEDVTTNAGSLRVI